MNMEAYQIEKKMSSALYGSVWLGRDKATQQLVAIKEMNIDAATKKTTVDGVNAIHEDAFTERVVNRHLSGSGQSSPYIVALLRDFEQAGQIYLVFEYCAKGELFGLLEKKNIFSAETTSRYFQQIARGVCFMHEHGFAHRDLSLENVLVDEEDVAKVCDFGLVTSNNPCKEVVGKLFYMAPEVIAGKEYNPALADIWSLGIMLFIMLTGVPPIEMASSSDNRFRLIKSRGIIALLKYWRMDTTIPIEALDLMTQLLSFNPQDRLSIENVLSHPFLTMYQSNQIDESNQYDVDSIQECHEQMKACEIDVETKPKKWKLPKTSKICCQSGTSPELNGCNSSKGTCDDEKTKCNVSKKKSKKIMCGVNPASTQLGNMNSKKPCKNRCVNLLNSIVKNTSKLSTVNEAKKKAVSKAITVFCSEVQKRSDKKTKASIP